MDFNQVDIHASLKKHFGFSQFKGLQEGVVKNVLQGKNTFVIMPTGGGKSLCFQLPALMCEGTAIVVSPLIALMKNQVDAIRGISEHNGVAHVLNSSLNKTEVAQVKEDKKLEMNPDQEQLFGIDKLNVPRSEIPAVTHVDYSARVQTVHHETNPRFHNLLDEFDKLTNCPVLVNTSFNVRGEPIVSTPEDAYRCFIRTEMDYLVIENFIMAKSDQPNIDKDKSWMNEFELD